MSYKILCLWPALPHYMADLFERMQSIPEIELVVVLPLQEGITKGKGVHEVENNKFRILRLPEYNAFYKKAAFKDLHKTIKEEKPDIILSTWPYAIGFGLLPKLINAVRKTGCKLIMKEIPFQVPLAGDSYSSFYRRGIINEDGSLAATKFTFTNWILFYFGKWARKCFLLKMDAHLNYIEEAFSIIGSYGVPKEKIFITYNSPDTDKLLAAHAKAVKLPPILPENKYRLIHVGRLVNWKRVDLLIEVIANLSPKYTNLELIVVGYGPEENTLKEQAERLGIAERVKFIGGIYDPVELARYYLASTVYVLAGMGGLSINEAMAFGKPVICSVCDGTEKHLVRENKNGYFFENNNGKSLEEKISLLLENPEKPALFGRESMRIITDEINSKTMVDKYLSAFEFVLRRR